MNADEYAKAALKTWTDEWSVPQQVAHAAMTIADEWWEVEELLDGSKPLDLDDLADELGDVMYGVVIMQTLVAWPYLPEEWSSSANDVRHRARQVHDLATKYFRSEALDHYDADEIADALKSEVLCLADCLCGFIRSHGLEPMKLAEANAAKLAKRHG